MEKFLPWVASIATGLVFITLVNFSPLGHLGFAIALPSGWSGTTGQYNCTGKFINGCGDCGSQRDGIPFVVRRQQTPTCFVQSNTIALLLDALTGAGIGVLGMVYIFIADRDHDEKQPLSSQ